MAAAELFRRARELQQAGEFADAEKLYDQILREQPNHFDALLNLSLIYQATERLPQAMAIWHDLNRIAPTNWFVYMLIGLGQARLGQFDQAIVTYRQGLLHSPGNPELHHVIGLALRNSGRLQEARASWEAALSRDPSQLKYWLQHGQVCAELGDFNQAFESARQAIALKPDHAPALGLAGAVLRDLQRDAEAEEYLRKAIELQPDFAPALDNYGLALAEAGLVEDALAMFRRALAADPNNPAYFNNLFALNYSAKASDSEVFAEHRRWAELHADHLAPAAPPTPRPRAGDDRLRIGYVSADFRTHPAALVIRAFFPHHDREKFHIFAYSNVQKEDEATAKMRAMVESWRPITGLIDEQVAKLVRDDGIDILVDLSGHTAGNRLLVFARQPAPVQATLFIYPNTTGLRTMQYRVTDDYFDPPGQSESLYTEKLIRVPEICWCQIPRAEAPPVSIPPATKSGNFTFGSLHNPAKVTDEVISLWSRILKAAPNSRLLITVGRSPLGRKRIEDEFAKAGISSSRLEILHRLSLREYLDLYARIDVALDPFPYNGVTTTFDTLWMGVPVVTLPGTNCRSRHGLCLLSNIGLTQFIAKDADDYVRIATNYANRLAELAEIRAGLRERVQQSPIVRGDLYAARLEAAFRQMWTDAGHT